MNLSKFENQIKKLSSENSARETEVRAAALAYMAEALKIRDTELKALVASLEASRDLAADDEFPYQWVRFTPSDFINTGSELQRDLFRDYMAETYGVSGVDFENDCLMLCIGECIVINEDGDIFDSTKCIIHRSDYSLDDGDGDADFTKRNKLIEAHMEKTGFFPSVIRQDRHGNVFYVDTQSGVE